MNKFLSIKFRFLGLLVFSFTVVVAYGVWLNDKERNARIDLVSEQISQSAKLISIMQKNLTDETSSLLEVMSKDRRLTKRSGDCFETLQTYQAGNPEYANLGITDPSGMIQCMSLGPVSQDIDLSRFPFFVRATAGQRQVMSDVQISPVSGKATLYFAQASRKSNGDVDKVLFASVDLDWLNDQVAQYSSLAGSTLSIIDGKGALLADFKPSTSERPFLQKVTRTDDELFRNLLSKNKVGTALTRGKEGNESLIGFVNFGDTTSGPAFLIISIDKELALAPTLISFKIQISLTILLLTLIWVLIYQGGSKLFVSRINSIYQATKRFSVGDYAARAGFKAHTDELDMLGHAFDEMAMHVENQHNQLSHLNDLLKKSNRLLKVLSHGNHAMLECKNEAELISRFLDGIVNIGGYQVAAIAELGEAGNIYPRLRQQFPEAEEDLSLVSILNKASALELTSVVDLLRDKTALSLDSSSTSYPSLTEHLRESGINALALLPITHNHVVEYVLLKGTSDENPIAGEELAYLQESAHDISFGMVTISAKRENARLTMATLDSESALRASLEDTLAAIAAALEMRDPYTAGHERRVAELATALASKVGLNEEESHSLYLAGIVHDIGKIKIPSEILVKPGKLSEIEYSLVKEHASAGYEILQHIDFPWPIAEIVRQHHERLDGSGYPQGLKMGEILYRSRILAVADVVESMASHRPYRPSLGIDAALDEIESGKGIRYDASVVDACIDLFKTDHFDWRH